MEEKIKAIILAAGEGTRMKSKTPKVLHKVLGRTLLDHAINAAKDAGAQDICVVVGHQAELVKQNVSEEVTFVLQEQQLGTGHAVMQAEHFIEEEGDILVLFGDTPLITGATLGKMVDFHRNEGNGVTLLSAMVDDPSGYGRIIRGDQERFLKSVEHKDASEEEREVKEINSGMYCFQAKELKEALKTITNDNAQGEYYLPDTLNHIMDKKLNVNAMVVSDPEEILGVNSRVQLAEAEKIMKTRINKSHMENGVTIIDPENTYIQPNIIIGRDTILYPGTILEGNTVIGEDCIIGPNSRIIDSEIKPQVQVNNSIVIQSSVGEHTTVGPFAYIRPNSTIGEHAKIGDFVEVKNATIGNHTKASHLTYIGDADVGSYVNFGCGTVLVNYDGAKKHRTVIKDHAFIGCNTNLVSPVTVGKGGHTAAGSTITEDVPEDSLAIARARQVNKENWAKKKK